MQDDIAQRSIPAVYSEVTGERWGRLKFLLFLLLTLPFFMAVLLSAANGRFLTGSPGLDTILVGMAYRALLLWGSVKRFHDLGFSGWASLITLVPYLGVFTFIGLLGAPGEKGANKFGGKPAMLFDT